MDSNSIVFMKRVAAAAIAFFLLLQSPSPTNALTQNSPTSLVDGVCRKAQNYADCVSALELDSRTPSASDLKTLARISLDIAVTNTTNSKAFIQKLAASNSTKPSLIPALKQCISAYESSAESFKSAKLELEEDISSANYDAKVAGDGAVECENELKSGKEDVPSVKARNYFVSLYSDIGFVITDQLGG